MHSRSKLCQKSTLVTQTQLHRNGMLKSILFYSSPEKCKVGVILANMRRKAMKIYDSFTLTPEVEANEEAVI